LGYAQALAMIKNEKKNRVLKLGIKASAGSFQPKSLYNE
jgi:hypothetical protein